jgi:small neutral amino acid transporter SnatA (MarC family)
MPQAFYPLTVPMTVDPGAMSVAVTIGANHAHKLDRLLIQLLAAAIGATIIALAISSGLSLCRAFRAAHRARGHEPLGGGWDCGVNR